MTTTLPLIRSDDSATGGAQRPYVGNELSEARLGDDPAASRSRRARLVYATFARRTYQPRLGFARYDLALSGEGDVLILQTGWRFLGWRHRAPLIEVLAEGWVPRPHGFHRT